MIKLVKNEKKYWEFIRELRCDKEIQDGFVENVTITSEQQIKYMKQYNDNYLVCLVNGQPAGYVGEIDGDIRVATHKSFQGKGIGTFMINEIMRIRQNLYAKVKIDNASSLALFKKCGFKVKYYLLEKDE